MKRKIEITDNLIVEENKKSKRTITSVIENGERRILTDIKTNDYFWSKIIFDENYIVVYSRGCMVNQIPFNIEAAYDIKEKRILDLSDKKLKVILEYMFINTRGFELTDVLTFINQEDLKILDEESKGDLKRILTSGNSRITDEEVIKYILSIYPILANYRYLKGPLTVIQYKNIEEEIGQEVFRFHLMPQRLKFLEKLDLGDVNTNSSDYSQIYLSEADHQQNVLKLQKTNNQN